MDRIRSAPIFALLATVSGLTAQAIDQAYIARVRSVLEASVDADHPAMALAIVHDGEVLLSEAVGYSDRKAETKVGGDDVFPLSEITASMSGLVAARLHAAGVIDLAAPIPFPIRDAAGTKHRPRLLEIVDGTVALLGFEFYQRREVLADWPLTRILADHVVHDPNTRDYEHGPFVVLQLVAERASGKAWHELVTEHFAEPVGLTTLVADARAEAPRGAVRRYRGGDQSTVPEDGGWSTVPAASGAWVSAAELGSLAVPLVTAACAGAPTEGDEHAPTERLTLLNGWRQAHSNGTVETFGYGPGVRAQKTVIPSLRLGWIFIGTSTKASMPRALDEALRSVIAPDGDEGSNPWNSAVGLARGVGEEAAPDLRGVWSGSVRSRGEDVRVAFEVDRQGIVGIEIAGEALGAPDPLGTFGDSVFQQVRGRFPKVHPKAGFLCELQLRLSDARDEFVGTLELIKAPYCRIHLPLRLTRTQ